MTYVNFLCCKKMSATTFKHTTVSVQCVEDSSGIRHTQVVYDDVAYPIFLPQNGNGNPAFGGGQGPHSSSVRPFQAPLYEDEEIPMEIDPPDITHSQTGCVRPIGSCTEVEVPMEVEQ